MRVRRDLSNYWCESFYSGSEEFRLDFRVPFPLFEEIVKEWKESNIFTTGRKKAIICDEFKVLACLRSLGRNYYVTASVRELLGAGKTTINDFFKKLFLRNYFLAYYKKYVFVPDELELNEVGKVYRYMGLFGCIGSMDVTHVQWGACLSALRHHRIARYGYPTLGCFNFICFHNRRNQYILKAFYGATNDITITCNDNYPRQLMLCQVHNDRIFRNFKRQIKICYLLE